MKLVSQRANILKNPKSQKKKKKKKDPNLVEKWTKAMEKKNRYGKMKFKTIRGHVLFLPDWQMTKHLVTHCLTEKQPLSYITNGEDKLVPLLWREIFQ